MNGMGTIKPMNSPQAMHHDSYRFFDYDEADEVGTAALICPEYLGMTMRDIYQRRRHIHMENGKDTLILLEMQPVLRRCSHKSRENLSFNPDGPDEENSDEHTKRSDYRDLAYITPASFAVAAAAAQVLDHSFQIPYGAIANDFKSSVPKCTISRTTVSTSPRASQGLCRAGQSLYGDAHTSTRWGRAFCAEDCDDADASNYFGKHILEEDQIFALSSRTPRC